MATIETTLAVPLTVWEDGSIRITGSRVTLDSIVHGYKLGATPEQLADSFPPLALPDIYAAIAYYLTHRAEVEEYLRQREAEGDAVQQRIESDPNYQVKMAALRELILARWAARQEATGQNYSENSPC
ncbi:MAG: DUF433 domain-containing protein [Pyrinomonadaceae bacterium]